MKKTHKLTLSFDFDTRTRKYIDNCPTTHFCTRAHGPKCTKHLKIAHGATPIGDKICNFRFYSFSSHPATEGIVCGRKHGHTGNHRKYWDHNDND